MGEKDRNEGRFNIELLCSVYTIHVWMYINSGNNGAALVNIKDVSTGTNVLLMDGDNGDITIGSTLAESVYSTNTWFFIALVKSASDASLYINNEIVMSPLLAELPDFQGLYYYNAQDRRNSFNFALWSEPMDVAQLRAFQYMQLEPDRWATLMVNIQFWFSPSFTSKEEDFAWNYIYDKSKPYYEKDANLSPYGYRRNDEEDIPTGICAPGLYYINEACLGKVQRE